MMKGVDSHVVQDTPATVWVTRAQALSTVRILLTSLHRNLGHLKHRKDRQEGLRCSGGSIKERQQQTVKDSSSKIGHGFDLVENSN